MISILRTISRSSTRTAAVFLVASSLLLAACGGPAEDATEPAATEPAPGDEPAPEPTDADDAPSAEVPATTPDRRSAPEGSTDCSTQGQTVTVVAVDWLPDEVLAQRDFLIDAALRCDEQLLTTAMTESDLFSFSFGGDDDALTLWWDMEEAGEAPFLRLAQVLATTPAIAANGEVVVWPRVTTGRPEDTITAAWQELTWLDDVDAASTQGDGYLDWRAGISTDGQWRFFVIGD